MPNGGEKNLEVKPTFGRVDPQTGRYRIAANHRTRQVAQMVCEAFHGLRANPSDECMHLDETRTNNRPSNLQWGSKVENQTAPKLTARRSVLMRNQWVESRGARAQNIAKLNEEQVTLIRASNESLSVLASRFSVSKSTIHLIRKGTIWRHVA